MSDWNRRLSHYLPAWQWLKHYDTPTFKSDLLASFIVIAMLVPQGMAYAMLVGLPPITGLYASIIPMIIMPSLVAVPHFLLVLLPSFR